MTYLAMYIESLEKRIQEGGTQAEVDKAVAEYNTYDPEAFTAWFSTLEKVSCASCGKLFKPHTEGASTEVLCEEHLLK